MRTTTARALTADPLDRAVRPVSHVLFGATCIAAGVFSVLLGDGIRSPALGLCALVACIAGATTGPRSAFAFGALAGLVMAVLALAEATGLLPAPAAASSWFQALLLQLVVLACGMAGAGLIFNRLEHHRRAAADREQRFQGLLGMAGDLYWEMDRNFRFTRMSPSRQGGSVPDSDDLLNRTPWQAGTMGLSPDELDAHIGQVIRIVNQDDHGHTVGPFFVAARSTLTQRFASAGTFTGTCSVHPSGTFVLKVVA